MCSQFLDRTVYPELVGVVEDGGVTVGGGEGHPDLGTGRDLDAADRLRAGAGPEEPFDRRVVAQDLLAGGVEERPVVVELPQLLRVGAQPIDTVADRGRGRLVA